MMNEKVKDAYARGHAVTNRAVNNILGKTVNPDLRSTGKGDKAESKLKEMKEKMPRY